MIAIKKLFLAIIIFTLTSCCVFASEDDTTILDGKSGVERLEVLLELANKYIDDQSETSLKYSKEAIELAVDLKLVEKEIDGYNTLGFGFFKAYMYQEAMNSFLKSYEMSVDQGYTFGEASSKNGTGLVALGLGDYKTARKNFETAHEMFVTLGNQYWTGVTLDNLGSVFKELGSYDLAIVKYLEAMDIFKAIGEKEEIANTSMNIASLNSLMGNFDQAFEYFNEASVIYEALEDKLGAALVYNSLGDFLSEYELYEDSYSAYLKSLTIYGELEKYNELSEVFSNIAYILEVNEDYTNAKNYYEKALEISLENDHKENSIVFYNNLGTLMNNMGDYKTAVSMHESAFDIAREVKSKEGLKYSLRNLSLDYEALSDYETAYYYYSLYNELNDQIGEEEIAKNFANEVIVNETEEREQEIIQKKEVIKQKEKEAFIQMIIIGLSLLVIAVVSVLGFIIAKERKKSEKLLLNVLPKKVAEDLKKNGETLPESFDNISVYFSDIVGFTNISTGLDPKYLIGELSSMFTMFDEIMERHNCERIKTIGDAYMAVCGMPTPNKDHALNLVKASQEILVALQERNAGQEIEWRIRIGVHSGKVTGGVVGTKKYIYDVFGDTVNTASRMESNGAPMRINISSSTHELVQEHFEFEERDPLEVKGKGQQIMYFVK